MGRPRSSQLLAAAGLIASFLMALLPGERQTSAALPGANGRVAFDSWRATTGIYTMNADGTDLRAVATGGYDSEEPDWSPDGRQIAFTSNRVEGRNQIGLWFQIYVMNADGSDQHRISSGIGNDASPSWSPDGTTIAFDSDANNDAEIYVVRADGSAQRDLTNSPAGEYDPVWSPDGTKIAFISDRAGALDIWAMNSDGSSPVNITNGGVDAPSMPDWSPDGNNIVFSARDGDHSIIDVIGLETRAVHQVSPIPGWLPAWSADGSRVSFSGPIDGGGTGIYSMNADGGGLQLLTGSWQHNMGSSWQPLTCAVAGVLDGNSLSCTDGRLVRLRGVNAPAGDECGAGWARAALADIFLPVGRTVRLQYGAPPRFGPYDFASPLWRGDDGADYNVSVVMAYVGLARATGGDSPLGRWLLAAEAWARAAQWNMWAPGGPFNGSLVC